MFARTLVVRLWLPDRPGALGQVASRIGAVHGDVTAIDILERGGGRVIDELVVSLPEAVSVDLLAKEIDNVDGVAVEQIRVVVGDRPDSATATLQLAAEVAAVPRSDRLAALVSGLVRAADAEWAIALGEGTLLHQVGQPPDLGWLVAFVAGSGHLDPAGSAGSAPADVLWARLPSSGVTVAAGRAERAVHEQERTRLILLARIVDALI